MKLEGYVSDEAAFKVEQIRELGKLADEIERSVEMIRRIHMDGVFEGTTEDRLDDECAEACVKYYEDKIKSLMNEIDDIFERGV